MGGHLYNLGLYSFYVKDLGSAGFSIAQPMLMSRTIEANWAPAAAANFCNNYQKSNKNHFSKNVCKCSFSNYIFKHFLG